MGIVVSATKVVTVNDAHQNGVDTSVEANPTFGKLKGIRLIHVYSRNHKGDRRDDGNPLMHALKARRGFSIAPFWAQQLMTRARQILEKVKEDLQGFDYCMPIPSSSPFCAQFAALVSDVSGVQLLDPSFLRKRQVGELLADARAAPPRMRPGLRGAFASQLHAWEQMDPTAVYQAKDIDLGLRPFFGAFALPGNPPELRGKRVLIVDDLFASGSSLLSVREILQNQLGAEVAGVCFLSGV